MERRAAHALRAGEARSAARRAVHGWNRAWTQLRIETQGRTRGWWNKSVQSAPRAPAQPARVLAPRSGVPRPCASVSRGRRLYTERPTLAVPRPEQKREEAECKDTDTEHDHRNLRGGENEDPSRERHQCRERVEPHTVRTRHIWLLPAQQDQSKGLSHELHQDPSDDKRVNHCPERKEARHDGDRAEHEQRDVREVLGRVQPAEHAEEVAALRRSIGDARVTQEKREHRPECGPEHQQREDRRHARAVYLLHEGRNDEVRLRVRFGRYELPPRYDADDREVDAEIDHGNRCGADEDRARDDAARIAHLVADVADVVITQVVVDPDAGGRAQAEEETDREVTRRAESRR